MLSAIAVRKAALAVRDRPSSGEGVRDGALIPSVQPLQSSTTATTSTTSKRKSYVEGQNTHSSRKKKRKERNKREELREGGGGDVIIVDSDGEGEREEGGKEWAMVMSSNGRGLSKLNSDDSSDEHDGGVGKEKDITDLVTPIHPARPGMLSAIAARKARQGVIPPASPVISTPSIPPVEVRPASTARNLPTQATKTTGRREEVKKKKENKEKRRYFDCVQRDEDSKMVVDTPTRELALEDEEDVQPNEEIPPTDRRRQKRWSPSRPFNDSSEDGDSSPSGDANGKHDEYVVPPTTPQVENKTHPRELSTFVPMGGENVYSLDGADLAVLGLSTCNVPRCSTIRDADTRENKAVLLALHVGKSLCLVGTYTFLVLQGSVSIAGVTLFADLGKRYGVYAPRCAPVPVLEGKGGGRGVNLDFDGGSDGGEREERGWRRLVGVESVVLVVLWEMKTGVEGLGKVCRIFEGVFEVGGRGREEESEELGLEGVCMVKHERKDVNIFEMSKSWVDALDDVSTSIGVGDDGIEEKETDIGRDRGGVYLVKGPKGSGKSTFARTLVNRLLLRYKRVAYLECDLGQPEFSIGGMVALNVVDEMIFGPPFTHPTLPTIAHFIGGTTPRSCPALYLDAVRAILESYQLDVRTPILEDVVGGLGMGVGVGVGKNDGRIEEMIPLVINTMGWSKGLGRDLTMKIEEMAVPGDVFEFGAAVYGGESGLDQGQGQRQEQGWGESLIWTSGEHLEVGGEEEGMMMVGKRKRHVLEPVGPSMLSMNYNAMDHRSIGILSYFHAVFPSSSPPPDTDFPRALTLPPVRLDQVTAVRWDATMPLCARLPYQVECREVFEQVILVGAGMEDVVLEEVGRVLNGALVGIVGCERECEFGVLEEGSGMGLDATSEVNRGSTVRKSVFPYTQGSPPPAPAMSRCLGLALIRSVSLTTEHMHVLTPIPLPVLVRGKKVLVKGEMELPVWGMLDFREEGSGSGVAGVERGRVPFLQWGKAGGGEGGGMGKGVIGAEKRRVRRNLMRRGQM